MNIYETVIISVHHNRASVVEHSIKSVVEQLSNSDLLLLVDDGSTDETLEELNKFSSRNVQIVTWANIGFTASIRKAIDLYDSKFIAIHGAGDFSLAGRFSKQAQILRDNPEVVVVGAYHKNINTRVNIEYIAKNKIDIKSESLILKRNPFSHSEVMFRRDTYDKVGGYRTAFKFAQDRDLWCRMSSEGEFYIIEDVLVERYHATSGSVSGDYSKTLHQRYLSDFALHCHRLRLKNGPQADKNIEFTMLKYEPSFQVQKELFGLSLKLIKRREFSAFSEYRRHVSSSYVFKTIYLLLSPLVLGFKLTK